MTGESNHEHPGSTEAHAALIRRELEAIFASDAFKGGKRAQEFLQLVVEHALAGRFDDLRERMLGAEMFGRSVDYDTANDAVVRVKASEVRRRLAHYYSASTVPPKARIDLPPGTYVPHFSFVTDTQGAVVDAVDEPPAARLRHSEAAQGRTQASRRLLVLAALGILVAAGIAAWRFWVLRSIAAPVRSIAVLPLSDYSGNPSKEYFADGMTAELTAELAQVSSLRVIARTSTLSYKGTNKTIPQIAKELGVEAVVEGSVELVGDQVRITAQLIDAKTDRSLWARTYDRAMTNVLQLQRDVAQAICSQIRAQITPQEQSHFDRVGTIDPDAVTLYLQGMQQMNQGDPGKAIVLFQQAIDKAPSYAEAHTALASAFGWEGEAGWMPYSEAFSRQRSEALQAIQLDDSRPEPHLQLAMAALDQSWDWKTAQSELQKALTLGPNSTDTHWAWSNVLLRLGESEPALAEANKALELDPVSGRAFMNRAFTQYFARHYDAALADMQSAAALPHTKIELAFPLGDIYVEKNLYSQAVQEFSQLGDAPHALGHLGNLYARHGDQKAALALAAKLKEQVPRTGIGRYEIALIYAGLHDNDEAFQWLDLALKARDKGILYIKIDPCLDPLRSDPRFAALLRSAGFPS
jgi:TolB-like protein/Tfp pilus assembly protein PilF